MRSTASLDYIINIVHSTLCQIVQLVNLKLALLRGFLGIEAKRCQNNWHLEVLEHELRLITNRTGDSVN